MCVGSCVYVDTLTHDLQFSEYNTHTHLNINWCISWWMLHLCYIICEPVWKSTSVNKCEFVLCNLCKELILSAVLFSFPSPFWPFPLVSLWPNHIMSNGFPGRAGAFHSSTLHCITHAPVLAPLSALPVKTARAPQNNLYLNFAVTRLAALWLCLTRHFE